MPLSYREFSASATDNPGPGTGISGTVEKYFESFWSGDVGGLDKLDQRGNTESSRGLDTRSLALAARPPGSGRRFRDGAGVPFLNHRPMPTRGREAPLVEKRCPAGAPDSRALASHVSCETRLRPSNAGSSYPRAHSRNSANAASWTAGPRGAHARELRGGEAARPGPASGTPPHRSGPRRRHPTRASSRTGPTTRGEGRASP